MPRPVTSEISSDALITAALAGEPYDLPVSYEHLANKLGRNNVVANRIAKNIGPLLGVPDPDGPFGEMSWLCDFERLTLGEIARGAPEPTRAELSELRTGTTDTSDWRFVGRAVYGKTPQTIVNATLNKFGPDTKSGVVLTGLNQLLEPQTQTLVDAITSDTFQKLRTEEQLRAYGAMTFGAYRLQPLFFHAGLSARGMQRSLKLDHERAIFPHPESTEFARCELSAAQPDSSPTQVFELDIIDEPSKSFAEVLNRRNRRGASSSPGSLADYAGAAIQQLYGVKWQEEYSQTTGRRAIRCFESSTDMSTRFAAGVSPYVTHGIVGELAELYIRLNSSSQTAR
jgi:hypothetical protein